MVSCGLLATLSLRPGDELFYRYIWFKFLKKTVKFAIFSDYEAAFVNSNSEAGPGVKKIQQYPSQEIPQSNL
jgi:hypothetical protein